MYKKIADNRGEDKNKRINYRIIYLFLLLLLFTLPVTIPLPVGGKHIVVYIAELVIIFEWFIQALYFKFGFPQTDYFDRKYIGRIRIVSILLGIYIIVTRLFFLISGFDAEWLTYPRITLIFLISLFWIVRKRFESNDKITFFQLYSWDIEDSNYTHIVFDSGETLDDCYQRVKDADLNLSKGDIVDNLNSVGVNMEHVAHILTDQEKDTLKSMFTLDDGTTKSSFKR